MAQPAAQTDRDLASIAEARALVRRAKAVAPVLAEFSQQQIDAIVDAMAAAATPQAEALARLAVDETGYGVVADKIQKNLFASQKIYNFIRPMKTVGVIARFDDQKVIEIAEPFGVVAAIVPTTNPTSTALYKILISMKARCPIVISPHPSAVRCITRSAELMNDAARKAGAPEGAINWMTQVTLEGTQELMKARETAVILATGGMGLVRAAYSAGKPAYGVGPGNAPAYIERTADVTKAVRDIVTGKTFDNGLLCSSENSVVVDAPLVDEVKRQFVAQGRSFSFCRRRSRSSGKSWSRRSGCRIRRSSASPRPTSREQAGIAVGPGTRVLIAELAGVGRDYPLSIEKLCPVLSFYVVSDWKEGCERCKQILRYGGMGHTMSIHSRNEDVILQFGLKKPAFRIVVNTPTTLGSIGFTTSLDPSMTLGCGGWGGNITSDNISPQPPPQHQAARVGDVAGASVAAARGDSLAGAAKARASLPKVAATPPPAGIAAASLARRIDQFLASRGYAAPAAGAAEGNHRATESHAHAGQRAGGDGPKGNCRKGGRLRMRRRRPPGGPAGAQNCNRRADDRDAGGAGPWRAAPGFRPGRVAPVSGENDAYC